MSDVKPWGYYPSEGGKPEMTALTREELLDVDPVINAHDARWIALRHAWNWAVEAEDATTDVDVENNSRISQAWSAIAEALK